jgi:hypothetical protein
VKRVKVDAGFKVKGDGDVESEVDIGFCDGSEG